MDIYYARRVMREQHLSIFDMELVITYYARVSSKTDEQQNSKENQIEHFEDFISRNTKWTLVKGYVDDVRGESAANRESFLRMVEDAKRGKFDYIFTKETSRFGRDLIDCVSYTRELMSYGVCVYFESDGINTIDPDAELKLGLMATLAQEEVRKLSERVKFGHKRSIQSNRILGNDRIFGYHYNKNGLTINEEEAGMVRKLFEYYATDQYSLRQLEDIIWGMGYVGRAGTKVSHHTFANIIKNPKYKGYYCGGKVRIEDYRTKKQRFLPEEEWRMFKDETGLLVPQIVSEELWEQANIILARRSRAITNHRSSLKKNSPFTGMIFCTVDGKPYWRQSNNLKSGQAYMWLCSEKRRHGTSVCPSFAIYERELYQLLNDALLPKLKDISQSVNDYLECYARSGGSQENQQEIRRLEKAIEKVNRKKDRLLDLSLDDSITKAEFVKRNDALTAELEPLEEELERLRRQRSKDTLLSDVEDLRRYFLHYLEELSGAGEKITLTDALIKKLIQRIEATPVSEHEMELNIILKTQQETRALYQNMPRRSSDRRRAEPGIVYKAQSGPPQPILRSGFMGKLIALLAAVLLGGGGGLAAMFGGQSAAGQGQTQPQTGQNQSQTQTGSVNWGQLLSGLGGGAVSSGWQQEANTGRLDTTVASGARDKYTKLLGGGKDTATIMVYMCGTDLESRSGMGTADLQEMLNAQIGNSINLLVYTGGCSQWKNSAVSSSTNQIWQVKNGQLVKLQDNLGSVPMTDPGVLSEYISWCARNFPASRYELILWDHGGGSVSGYGYDEKFASAGSMDLAGIDTALKAANVKFDFISFDACLMATAETALTLTEYADYLIASEETEPGVGWYYTDWLNAFGQDISQPTIQLGEKIVDSFVDTCARECPGQLTTLSVIDLAELEHTLPDALADFSRSTSQLIREKEYQTVSNARSGAREFARSSRIDQVDLVHLAKNLGTKEGDALADVLLGAVKYNNTSSNMTNAYGISIYFPYQRTSSVDKAVDTYRQIGMDEDYARCIQQFASLEASGQAVSGGTASPLPSLLGALGGSGGGDMISSLLGSFLSGDVSSISGLTGGNTGFLSNKAMSDEDMENYLTDNRFPSEALVWQEGDDGGLVLRLEESQWGLVQGLELNLFYDDGEGYIDLGLDNVYEFDDAGGLLGPGDTSWLAIDGQPVAYYHTATVDDGVNYTISGYVPVLLNGKRAELILVFDNQNPDGVVVGVQTVYTDGETETVSKSRSALEPGDTLEFLCDYYGYGGEYQDSFLLGDPVTVGDSPLVITNVPLEGTVRTSYRFTDLFNQHYWSMVE